MANDVESLNKSGSPRLRCLDVFLVASIVFLFVTVAVAVTVGGLMGMKLRLYLPSTPQPHTDVYKMQHFAYLQAKTSTLENGNMRWSPVAHGAGSSVGSLFVFDEAQHSIAPTRGGHYFIYVDLQLTCTHRCEAGHFTVSIGDHLNCTVELPKWNESTPVSKRCWQVATMIAEKRLVTKMIVPKGLDYWTLDMAASGQGFFLVD